MDAKVYQLNEHIKNFLKKNNDNDDEDINIKDNNNDNNDINNNSDNNDNINISNSNKESNNKKLNNTIEENIEEENSFDDGYKNDKNEISEKIEEEEINKKEKEINSINNIDNIGIKYSSPNTKEGSVTLSNIKDSKESKGKEKSESPSLIIVKKDSTEINKDKRNSEGIKNIENRFGQIMGPQIDLQINETKHRKSAKNKDKDCIIF